MADHIVFMEGWTLYCEQMMVEQDWFADLLLKLNYLADVRWRAYRMVMLPAVRKRGNPAAWRGRGGAACDGGRTPSRELAVRVT